MKTHLALALCTVALLLHSCSNHTLEPTYDCELPTLGNATVGTYGVYLHTNLDSLGNVVTGIETYDTLTIISKSIASDNTLTLGIQDRFSTDFGTTWRTDTITWVITGNQFKVQNHWLQQQCTCFDGLLKYRIYDDCSSNSTIIADNKTVAGDILPSLVRDNMGNQTIVNTTTNATISNLCTAKYNENIMLGTRKMLTKKSESNISFTYRLLEPQAATFVNGKRTSTVTDNRHVWVNHEVGLIKERVMVTEDTPNPHNLYFERVMVQYITK